MSNRAEASAIRRAALFAARLAAAGTDKARANAAIGWWLAEFSRTSAADRTTELNRLLVLAADMNQRSFQ